METSLFHAFRDLAFAQAGIKLGDAKRALVASRVGKRVRALGLRDERHYWELLAADESGQELIEFLDVLSTNHTSFFREPDHFARLHDLVEAELGRGRRRFRFWSAASSSGEEPYSMAIVLADLFAGLEVDWRILATDLSTRVLRAACLGEYGEQRLSPVPPEVRRRHFEPTGRRGVDGPVWRVKAALRERVVFKRLNLAQPPYPMTGPLDAVLCRNVMIYLAPEVRQGFVTDVQRLLRPGGLLMIGHAETLTGIRSGLRMLAPSIHRKAFAG